MEYQLKNETHRIIGCCMAVHNELGHGFYEPVYHEALEIEFCKKSIPYEREVAINIMYKGHELSKHYSADFLCFGNIILEIKAITNFTDIHISQVIN